MEDSQEARTWWKQWIWVEKLIFPVSVTQKEQLSGVFIFDFEKSAFLAHPNQQPIWDIKCHTLSYYYQNSSVIIQISAHTWTIDCQLGYNFDSFQLVLMSDDYVLHQSVSPLFWCVLSGRKVENTFKLFIKWARWREMHWSCIIQW